jgi:hypothetical protein
MALTGDIAATYRRPGRVIATKIATRREELALAYLMLGCGLVFVGQWPKLQRDAYLAGEDLQPLIGASLFAWIFAAPVLLYLLAWLVALLSRAVRRPVGGFGSRMALFWALVAASPLWLLNGLTAGLIGPGPALSLVGFFAAAAFLWFWIAGLRTAHAVEAGGEAA